MKPTIVDFKWPRAVYKVGPNAKELVIVIYNETRRNMPLPPTPIPVTGTIVQTDISKMMTFDSERTIHPSDKLVLSAAAICEDVDQYTEAECELTGFRLNKDQLREFFAFEEPNPVSPKRKSALRSGVDILCKVYYHCRRFPWNLENLHSKPTDVAPHRLRITNPERKDTAMAEASETPVPASDTLPDEAASSSQSSGNAGAGTGSSAKVDVPVPKPPPGGPEGTAPSSTSESGRAPGSTQERTSGYARREWSPEEQQRRDERRQRYEQERQAEKAALKETLDKLNARLDKLEKAGPNAEVEKLRREVDAIGKWQVNTGELLGKLEGKIKSLEDKAEARHAELVGKIEAIGQSKDKDDPGHPLLWAFLMFLFLALIGLGAFVGMEWHRTTPSAPQPIPYDPNLNHHSSNTNSSKLGDKIVWQPGVERQGPNDADKQVAGASTPKTQDDKVIQSPDKGAYDKAAKQATDKYGQRTYGPEKGPPVSAYYAQQPQIVVVPAPAAPAPVVIQNDSGWGYNSVSYHQGWGWGVGVGIGFGGHDRYYDRGFNRDHDRYIRQSYYGHQSRSDKRHEWTPPVSKPTWPTHREPPPPAPAPRVDPRSGGYYAFNPSTPAGPSHSRGFRNPPKG